MRNIRIPQVFTLIHFTFLGVKKGVNLANA